MSNNKRITRKFILATSVMISVSLMNVDLARAETTDIPEQSEIIDEKYDDQVIKAEDVITNLEDILTEEQSETFTELISNEISDILIETILHHESGEFEKAIATYEKILDNFNLSKNELLLIELFEQLATVEVLLTESDYNNVHEETAELVEEPKEETIRTKEEPTREETEEESFKEKSEPDLQEEAKEDNEISNLQSFSAQVQNQTVDADDLYNKSIKASGATTAWNFAQDLKSAYPDDPRVEEAINRAANRLLIMGTSLHEDGRYIDANVYYELLLSDPDVDNSIHSLANVYYNQSLENRPLETADDLYIKSVTASGATTAWNVAQELKATFPNYSRVEQAVDNAANRLSIMGTSLHEDGRYIDANVYYELLLSDPDVHNTIYSSVEVYYEQSLANNQLETADDLYNESITASGATTAWNIAQELKATFPDYSRVNKAVNKAANRLLIMGTSLQEDRRYADAIFYYELLLADPEVENSLYSTAETQYNQSKAGIQLENADKLYNKSISASGATTAWNLAQELKEAFPDYSRVNEAVNKAANRLLIMGTSLHEEGRFTDANVYYELLLSDRDVDSSIYSLAEVYYGQSQVNQQLETADDLYNKSVTASGATTAWNVAQDLKTLFPNDSRTIQALNNAANRLLIMGTSLHENNNFKDADVYYQLLLSDQDVDNSIYSLAEVYYEQSQAKQTLRTAYDMYEESKSAYGASTAWNIALELKGTFPHSIRVNQAINNAAQRLLRVGTDSHKSGDFDNALYYYNLILAEPNVDSSLYSTASDNANLANRGIKLRTASEYYKDSTSASGASSAWSIAIEGLKVYPNDSTLLSALNKAANRILVVGRQQQKSGNKETARDYYSKVINEGNVSESIRTLGTVFLNQLDGNHKPVVYLDAGHGGHDPGASHSGVHEKTLNINTARYLKSELESRGYVVLMSRNSDVFLELTERAEEANDAFADIFISIHYNSMGGNGASRGIETFIHHTVASGFGQEPNRNNFNTEDIRIDESLNLADAIHSNLINSLGMRNRGVKGNNFGVLRNTDVPSVLLELGFMDNSTELSRIRTSAYQKNAAKAIADGVDNYFNGILN